MSALPAIESSRTFQPGRWLGCSALILFVFLLLLHTPDQPGVDRDSSHRMLLDICYRPAPAGVKNATFDSPQGPVAVLQSPIYVGKSIWRTMVWQIAANLLIATAFVFGAFKLPRAAAWWAVGLFAMYVATDRTVASWCSLMLLASAALPNASRPGRVLIGTAMGILASISIGHFIFAIGALALQLRREKRTSGYDFRAPIAFVTGFIGTWLLLQQPSSRMFHWLAFGLTQTWTPSAAQVSASTAGSYVWAAVAAIAWIALVLVPCRRRRDDASWNVVLQVSWGLAIAWKFAALQPGGSALLFFVTLATGVFLLLPVLPRRAAVLLAFAVVASAATDRMLLTDAAGRINRRVLMNANEALHLGSLRTRLQTAYGNYRQGLILHQIHAATANAPIGVLGDYASTALLNEFRVIPEPSLATREVRDERAARKNAQALLSADAPSFLLERIETERDVPTGLRDGAAQRAVYEGYDFVLTERNFLLWKKKTAVDASAAPQVSAEGTVRLGEPFALPADDASYWLELDCRPNLAGWLRDQLAPLPEPAFRVRDDRGYEISNPLPWRAARAGLVIQPFFRSEIALLRFESGESLPRVNRIVVDPPAAAAWAWSSTVRYRLYRRPPLVATAGAKPVEPPSKAFGALNRIPISVSAPFPPITSVIDREAVLFIHPDSILELEVSPADRSLRGQFAIAPGAYEGREKTDGVSFAVEFVPAVGVRKTLLLRHLDPALNAADRGLQSFSVELPPSSGGRLLLRTFNLPGGTDSFDWSYWQGIELK
jgi:hypothetical protein